MKKGAILHLEDDPDWIFHIQKLLNDEYDVRPAKNQEEAARVVIDLGSSLNLAILDISLKLQNAHDKQGFQFLRNLKFSKLQESLKVIVLSGFSNMNRNFDIVNNFGMFEIIGVFDKGDFLEKRDAIKQLINAAFLDLEGNE